MSETKILTIQEAMEITQEIPEIFAQLIELEEAGVEFVELGVEGDQIVIREVEKSNPTSSAVHVPSVNWNKDELLVSKAIEEEKRYTLSPWYIPDSLDGHDEWTDKEEIQRAFWEYLKNPDRTIKLQHNMDIIAGEWVEGLTWPHEVTVPIKRPEGNREITFPSGTPFLGVIWEPWAWELVKDGEILGLSIGGRGQRVEADMEDYDHDPMGKVSFAKMIQVEGEKFVVYSEDGSRSFGSYDTKEKAEERLRQIEYFAKADFKVGDFVSWNSSGGTARGKIERIEIDGTINVPDSSFSITGTEEEPAALIVVWREGEDGWEASDRKVGHKLDTLSPINTLQKAETFTPPKGVQENAKRALEWISEGLAGSGFTDVGRRRASQLANGEAVSLETVKRIYSYLSRHEADSRAEGFGRGEDGYPSAGRVAWDAWGGDAAVAWSRSISERFEKRTEPETNLADSPTGPIATAVTEMIKALVDAIFKHGDHDQSSHGRKGPRSYEAMAGRRAGIMRDGEKPGLRTDSGGRIINENATGGYLAGIPESVEISGFDAPLTPRDSMWHHLESDGEGGYRITPERRKQHEAIISDTVSNVPSSSEPVLHMLGGGPATGKSTFVRNSEGRIPDNTQAVHVNADDMKGGLGEFERMRMSSNDGDFFNAASFTHEESSYLAEMARKSAMAQSKSVVLDGTGNGNFEKFGGKIDEAKGFGYKVQATYLTVDTQTAVDRAFSRSLKESERRYVPESIVRGTHAKVSDTFPRAVAAGYFDSATVWFTGAGGAPILLASAEGTNLSIINSAGYSAFTAKAGN